MLEAVALWFDEQRQDRVFSSYSACHHPILARSKIRGDNPFGCKLALRYDGGAKRCRPHPSTDKSAIHSSQRHGWKITSLPRDYVSAHPFGAIPQDSTKLNQVLIEATLEMFQRSATTPSPCSCPHYSLASLGGLLSADRRSRNEGSSASRVLNRVLQRLLMLPLKEDKPFGTCMCCHRGNLDTRVRMPILDIRTSNGLMIGREAQTMAMPICTVVQTSVLEYDGVRLPGI